MLDLVDHAYLAQSGADSWDTLAWRAAVTIGTHHCDLVLMQWQEAAQTRSLFMLAEGTKALAWLGQIPAGQRDARRLLFGHRSYGTAVLGGGAWVITPSFLATGLGVEAQGPPWRNPDGDIDMSGGTVPASIIVVWLV